MLLYIQSNSIFKTDTHSNELSMNIEKYINKLDKFMRVGRRVSVFNKYE